MAIFLLIYISHNGILCLAYLHLRMLSSAGRASPLQGGGRRFEPVSIHQYTQATGRVAKRLNAADCKSATYWFRQFESAPSHHEV